MISSDNANTYIFTVTKTSNMPPQNKESERNRARIQRWLIEDGYKIREVPDVNSLFRIVAENVVGNWVEIIQPNTTADKIVIVSRADLTEGRKAKLMQMEPEKRLELFWELRLSLLQMGVGYSAIAYPLEKNRTF